MMKNLYIKLLSFSLLLVMFTSCDKDEDTIILTGEAEESILLELEGDVLMDENYPDNPALNLVWSMADYGLSIIPNYSIEFATDASFTDPITVVETTEHTYSWTSKNLNAFLQDGMGLNANEQADVYIRIVSEVGEADLYPKVSNAIMISVIPFASYNFVDWHLVGDATQPGWNNNNNNPTLFRDPADPNVYSYTGYFGAGAFKLIEVRGQWAPMYGTNDSGATMTFRETESDPDPGVWQVDTPGYYTYTFNVSTLESTAAPFSGDTETTFDAMGLIGSATEFGWDADTPMQQSSFDPHVWNIPIVQLTGGEAKFRANNDWTDNWGSDTVYSGTGEANGANIPVISGTYEVWFYDLTGEYMFVPIQ